MLLSRPPDMHNPWHATGRLLGVRGMRLRSKGWRWKRKGPDNGKGEARVGLVRSIPPDPALQKQRGKLGELRSLRLWLLQNKPPPNEVHHCLPSFGTGPYQWPPLTKTGGGEVADSGREEERKGEDDGHKCHQTLRPQADPQTRKCKCSAQWGKQKGELPLHEGRGKGEKDEEEEKEEGPKHGGSRVDVPFGRVRCHDERG